MLDRAVIDDFLAQPRLAVVGVSTAPSCFATAVVRELRSKGYDVAAVGRHGRPIDGITTFCRLADVTPPVDGAIVMVDRDDAAAVVEEAAAAGIPRVWLFKGAGGHSAVGDPAVAAAEQHGMQLVAGACPLMFASPVTSVHRVHRFVRRVTGRLPRSPAA